MKKISLVLFIIMYNNFFYSMESTVSYVCNKTKINLKQGSHNSVDDEINLMVFGKNEQQALNKNFTDQSFFFM